MDALEAGPGPTVLAAVTVNEYGVPLRRPDTTQLVAPAVVQVRPPGADVTVYPVIGPPFAGAVQRTSASAFPAVAVTAVGALGGPTRTTLLVAFGPMRPAVSTAATA